MSKEKATHQDMTDFEGPVSTGDAKRKLDKKQGSPDDETNLPATVAVAPAGKVAEELSALFAGVDGLSEGFVDKATVLFEGAVSEHISNLRETLEAEYATKLDEQVADIEETLEVQLDRYLSLVVENYFKENEVAIDRGIRNEIAESVIASMVSIVENAGVELPEDKVDIAEELATEVEGLTTKLNESQEEIINLRDSVKKFKLEEAFRDNTEGLSGDTVDKLRKLTENINVSTIEQFVSKLEILKESLTDSPKNKNTIVEALTESHDETIIEANKGLHTWQSQLLAGVRNQ